MNYPDTDQLANSAIQRWRRGLPAETRTLRFERPWHTPADVLEIEVAYHCSTPPVSSAAAVASGLSAPSGSSVAPALHATIGGITISLDDPVALAPVEIPKQWGREVWYSGIETRGESRVRCDGGSLGLSTYLALAPLHLCRRKPLVLLKVLDPRPEPLLGELYLEVHEDKREVYVVTQVSPAAWPTGQGRIRYGINQRKRQEFHNDDAFRAAFLSAIQKYEALRQSIDAGIPGLDAAERSARQATLEFTAEKELSVGDVLSVPTWVPHSLQQGVRVIEFQTPTYERHIISSSQRVLTQDGWDSEVAINGMQLDPPADLTPEPVQPGIDRIVRFDEFSVWRTDLNPDQTIKLPPHASYALAICISGRLTLHGPHQDLTLEPDQAAFIPASAIGLPIRAEEAGLALLAGPDL